MCGDTLTLADIDRIRLKCGPMTPVPDVYLIMLTPTEMKRVELVTALLSMGGVEVRSAAPIAKALLAVAPQAVKADRPWIQSRAQQWKQNRMSHAQNGRKYGYQSTARRKRGATHHP